MNKSNLNMIQTAIINARIEAYNAKLSTKDGYVAHVLSSIVDGLDNLNIELRDRLHTYFPADYE